MLELIRVCFGYGHQKGGPYLLTDLSLKVERGGYVAILGSNATGKTTLAKLIKGLLHPSLGEIVIDGQPLYPGEGRSDVGLILSNPEDQLLFPTVEEEMAFGLECMGVEREQIRRRIRKYLSLLEMERFLNFPLHFLSRGQQQRVAIAAALALEPNYLLLDEVTSALEPRWRTGFMSILSKLNAKRKMAIIHFTTSIEEASLARSVLILENRRLTTRYMPADISSLCSDLMEKGCPLPPVAELCLRLEQKGHSIPLGMLTPEEMEAFLLGALRN